MCVDEVALKEVLAPLDPASGHIIEQVRDLSAIRRDLDVVGSLLLRLEKEDFDVEVEEAIWWSALLRYGRCFNESKTRASGLDSAKFIASLHFDQAVVHSGMLNLRNHHLAHAGSPAVTMERSKFVLVVKEDHFQPGAKHNRAGGWKREVYSDFREVATAANAFALVQCEKRFARLEPLLMRADVQSALFERARWLSEVEAELGLA
jgi:hypothetical protein